MVGVVALAWATWQCHDDTRWGMVGGHNHPAPYSVRYSGQLCLASGPKRSQHSRACCDGISFEGEHYWAREFSA